MLSQERIAEELQAQCDYAGNLGNAYVNCVKVSELEAVLKERQELVTALEDITKEFNKLADGLYTAHKAKEYKERAEAAEARAAALERIAKHYAGCGVCKHRQCKGGAEPCYSCTIAASAWEFDEARFEEANQ